MHPELYLVIHQQAERELERDLALRRAARERGLGRGARPRRAPLALRTALTGLRARLAVPAAVAPPSTCSCPA